MRTYLRCSCHLNPLTCHRRVPCQWQTVHDQRVLFITSAIGSWQTYRRGRDNLLSVFLPQHHRSLRVACRLLVAMTPAS